MKGRGYESGRAGRGRRVLEASRGAGGDGCGQDTVELLRDMMQDALDRLVRSRRRRDPVVALKIACKEACHWFSAGNRKGRGWNGDD
jgi:hypothetical protein